MSIQTGRKDEGKKCDVRNGAYSDVETLMTSGMAWGSLDAFLSFTFSFLFEIKKDVNSFITETISNLKEFEQIFSVDEYKIKVSRPTLSLYFFFS